jgi:aspartyl-tRNA(Asn)/glutamyl-tRNA(Gln) amidotransferase subunit A
LDAVQFAIFRDIRIHEEHDFLGARLAGLDALILPTTPIVAPLQVDVTSPEGFSHKNSLLLRNTAIANFFDLCAISLPLPVTDSHNSGLMLIARNGADRRLLAIAAAVEALLKG